jgi:hypothetical protein
LGGCGTKEPHKEEKIPGWVLDDGFYDRQEDSRLTRFLSLTHMDTKGLVMKEFIPLAVI